MLGVDVSNLQGAIDWPKVRAAGVEYAYLKATEGATFKDGQFLTNVARAREVGIKVGAYHYARPENNTPEAEAENFLSVVGKLDLRPSLDHEGISGMRWDGTATVYVNGVRRTPLELVTWGQEWLALVENQLRVRPVFYTYPSFWQTNLGATNAFVGYPLWLASYNVNDGTRYSYRPLRADWPVALHQYTSNGRISGISSVVDLNHAENFAAIASLGEPTMTLPNWLETIDNVIHVKKWVYDFIRWRLILKADPSSRPADAPGAIPAPVWRITEASHALAKEYAQQQLASLTAERDELKTRLANSDKELAALRPALVSALADKETAELHAAELQRAVDGLTEANRRFQQNFTAWTEELRRTIFGG